MASACFFVMIPKRLCSKVSVRVLPPASFVILLVVLQDLAACWAVTMPSLKSWITSAAWTSCIGPDMTVNKPKDTPPQASKPNAPPSALFLKPFIRCFRAWSLEWSLSKPDVSKPDLEACLSRCLMSVKSALPWSLANEFSRFFR